MASFAILARDADSSSRKGAKGAKKDRSKGFLGDLCDLSERPGLVLTQRRPSACGHAQAGKGRKGRHNARTKVRGHVLNAEWPRERRAVSREVELKPTRVRGYEGTS